MEGFISRLSAAWSKSRVWNPERMAAQQTGRLKHGSISTVKARKKIKYIKIQCANNKKQAERTAEWSPGQEHMRQEVKTCVVQKRETHRRFFIFCVQNVKKKKCNIVFKYLVSFLFGACSWPPSSLYWPVKRNLQGTNGAGLSLKCKNITWTWSVTF